MPFDEGLTKIDNVMARFEERNAAKPQREVFKATVELDLKAFTDEEAADILETLCENLARFSDIASAKGKLV